MVSNLTFSRTLDVGIGGAMGAYNAAHRLSFAGNAASLAATGVIGNAIGSLITKEKFLSKEMLTSTLLFTGSGVVMHFLIGGAIKQHEPKIVIAATPDKSGDCKPCWTKRMQEQQQAAVEQKTAR